LNSRVQFGDVVTLSSFPYHKGWWPFS